MGAAVLTIFVEGSVHERAEVDGYARASARGRGDPRPPDGVRFYGCPPEKLRPPLGAPRRGGGVHRRDAWDMVLGHAEAGPW